MAGIFGDSTSGGDFEREVMEADQYPGRCIGVIDMGTVPNTHPDAKNPTKRECMLIFEVSELMKPREDGTQLPFCLNWKGTASMGKNANLRKLLESWRGAKFTEAEVKVFDQKKVLDTVCLLSVTKTPDKQDEKKFYNNVGSVTPLPKMMKDKVIDRVNPIIEFTIDMIGTDTWFLIWPWVRKKIITLSEEGKEYRRKTGCNEFGEIEGEGGDAAGGSEEECPINPDDDIPF